MILKISGNNFHGNYAVAIRAQSGALLTDHQQARAALTARCGEDCRCGGGYGDGPDADSARIVDGRVYCAADYAAMRD